MGMGGMGMHPHGPGGPGMGGMGPPGQGGGSLMMGMGGPRGMGPGERAAAHRVEDTIRGVYVILYAGGMALSDLFSRRECRTAPYLA